MTSKKNTDLSINIEKDLKGILLAALGDINVEGSSEEHDTQHWIKPDIMLSLLVRLADGYQTFVDVTLVVEGLIMSGTIISEKKYIQQFGDVLASMYEKNVSNSMSDYSTMIRNTFDDIAEELSPTSSSDEAASGKTEEQIAKSRFIHLANVQLIFPQSRDYRTLPYWRCRLSKVSAWMIGRTMPAE